MVESGTRDRTRFDRRPRVRDVRRGFPPEASVRTWYLHVGQGKGQDTDATSLSFSICSTCLCVPMPSLGFKQAAIGAFVRSLKMSSGRTSRSVRKENDGCIATGKAHRRIRE